RRLLDAESAARTKRRRADRAAGGLACDPGDRPSWHDCAAEARVVLEAQTAGDEHARPQRLILNRDADVVPRRGRRGFRHRHRVGEPGSLAVPVAHDAELMVADPMWVACDAPVGLIARVMAAQL